jgi:glycerol-3-phosphate dehydrogenase
MGTKGSHLVLDHPALHRSLDGRMAYFEASDGRVCIAYPFLDRVLVGSTDIPVDDPDEAATEPAEIDYLLDVLRELFPLLHFGREQVVYTFVGVRPLARSDEDKPGSIARDHSVVVDPPNGRRQIAMTGLVGGKWTTFRALSEQATDEVLRQLGRSRTRSTQNLSIGGGAGLPADARAMQAFIERISLASGVSRLRAEQLVARYGTQAHALALGFASADERPLRHAADYSDAEILHLCAQTGVVHLADLVVRRTLLAIRGRITDALLAELAQLAAVALGWSAERRRSEVQACALQLHERHCVRLATGAEQQGAPSLDASLAPARPLSTPVPT